MTAVRGSLTQEGVSLRAVNSGWFREHRTSPHAREESPVPRGVRRGMGASARGPLRRSRTTQCGAEAPAGQCLGPRPPRRDARAAGARLALGTDTAGPASLGHTWLLVRPVGLPVAADPVRLHTCRRGLVCPRGRRPPVLRPERSHARATLGVRSPQQLLHRPRGRCAQQPRPPVPAAARGPGRQRARRGQSSGARPDGGPCGLRSAMAASASARPPVAVGRL